MKYKPQREKFSLKKYNHICLNCGKTNKGTPYCDHMCCGKEMFPLGDKLRLPSKKRKNKWKNFDRFLNRHAGKSGIKRIDFKFLK